MAIDIFNLEPTVISKNLQGAYICVYGPEKVGKTTFGAKLPRALFCNFEIGTNFLPGVKAVNVRKWVDFKNILRQLEKPQAKEMYDTVVIDTISEAYSDCERYCCAQAGVQKLGDVPYGALYQTCKKEFEEALRTISMLGFGVCVIAHSEKKNIPGPNDTTIETVAPAMPSRAAEVVNRFVDLIAYIDVYPDENGQMQRRFITRATPTIKAGSRLPYLDAVIPFSYEDLIDAIGRAVEKQQQLDGAVVVDKKDMFVEEKLDFSKVYNEAKEVWTGLLSLCPTDEEKERMVRDMNKKIEMVFGRKIKLSEVTEDQVDLLNLVLLELKDMLSEKQK